MAYSIDGPSFGTLTAAADYRTNQYFVGAVNSSGTFTLASVLGQRVDGVIQNDPNISEAVDLRCSDVTKVRYGGTVTAGDYLLAAANGEVVSQGNTPGFVLGVALVSGVNDEIGTMLINNRGINSVIWSVPITLANISGAVDVLTGFIPGFPGRIAALEFHVTTAVTTGSKAATLNLEIDATNTTGGTVALTSANCTPLGARVAGSAITAAFTFTAAQSISVEAASVTAFTEGAGVLEVHLIS